MLRYFKFREGISSGGGRGNDPEHNTLYRNLYTLSSTMAHECRKEFFSLRDYLKMFNNIVFPCV